MEEGNTIFFTCLFVRRKMRNTFKYFAMSYQ